MLTMIRRFLGLRPAAAPSPDNLWPLSRVLLRWSKSDSWTIGHACQGTIVLGATGSGKTTGSGRALAMAFLRSGFGGLVLCVKPDERKQWENYCRETGREDDLVVVDGTCKHRFSFLDEEVQRQGAGAGLCENVVQLFSTVLETAERNGGHGGRDDEAYWKRALRQLCRNLVDLLILAKGRVTVPDLYRLVVSAPTSASQLQSEEWKSKSFCYQCLDEADRKSKSPRQQRDFELVADYFALEFVSLSDKTRSVIVSTFTSLADVLNRGLLRDILCTDTNVRPADALGGKVLLIDLPVKEFAEVGTFAQTIFKYCFQKAAERRDVSANPRPVFLFADEFQHFVTSYDMHFQTTARSSRVATVYLTQNISNLIAGFGGESARALTDSLLGNLVGKVWHANADPVTNEWAASVIGRTRQLFMNVNTSHQPCDAVSRLMGQHEQGHVSSGMSEQMEFEVQPRRFTTLRTGGEANDWQVDALLFMGGSRFDASGRSWLPVSFRQRFAHQA